MRIHGTLLAVALLGAACAWNEPPLRARAGSTGPLLQWPAIDAGPSASGLTYEVTICTAVHRVPRDRVLHVVGLTATSYQTFGLPRGDYAWSVRARYYRDGVEWATPWMHNGVRNEALVPPRGWGCFWVP